MSYDTDYLHLYNNPCYSVVHKIENASEQKYKNLYIYSLFLQE